MKKISSAERILDGLNDDQIKLYYVFLDFVLPKSNRLNANFQAEKTVIASVHETMVSASQVLCVPNT